MWKEFCRRNFLILNSLVLLRNILKTEHMYGLCIARIDFFFVVCVCGCAISVSSMSSCSESNFFFIITFRSKQTNLSDDETIPPVVVAIVQLQVMLLCSFGNFKICYMPRIEAISWRRVNCLYHKHFWINDEIVAMFIFIIRRMCISWSITMLQSQYVYTSIINHMQSNVQQIIVHACHVQHCIIACVMCVKEYLVSTHRISSEHEQHIPSKSNMFAEVRNIMFMGWPHVMSFAFDQIHWRIIVWGWNRLTRAEIKY